MSKSDDFFLELLLSPKYDYNTSPSCYWNNVFTNEERRTIHLNFIFPCLFNFVIMVWLTITLTLTSLWKDDNYRFLTLFTVPAGMRRLLLVITSFYDVTIRSTCLLFASIDSFFGMLEIEGMTHAIISRFVMARYAANGWPMKKRLYEKFLLNSIAFAAFYTFMPLISSWGGSYDYDLTCTTCTYSMILPDSPERYLILFLFFIRYIKPVLIMIFMIVFALYLEIHVCKDDGNAKRRKFTGMMAVVIAVYIECCALMAFIRYTVMMDQLNDSQYYTEHLFGEGRMWIMTAYIVYAMWPCCVTMALMCQDVMITLSMCKCINRWIVELRRPRNREPPATAAKREKNETD